MVVVKEHGTWVYLGVAIDGSGVISYGKLGRGFGVPCLEVPSYRRPSRSQGLAHPLFCSNENTLINLVHDLELVRKLIDVKNYLANKFG